MDLFSDIETFTLANGVRCAVMPRAGYSIELDVFIATGSMHEGELLGSGMSHFLEHMLFQGCDGFPGRSAPEQIQRCGGELNAYTTFDRTVVTTRIAPEKLLQTMQIVGAMVRSTEVAPKRFDEEKQVILRECNRYHDQPSARIFEAAHELSFDRHPVRVPVIGYPELIAKLTAKELFDYHAARYTPGRCIIVAVGNVDAGAFRDAAESVFGDWRRAALAEPVFPAVSPAIGRRQTIFFSDPQERLLWGTPMPGSADDRAPAADLLFGMLGGAGSSYLPVQLELSTPLAQSIHAFYYSILDFGYAGIRADATPQNFDRLRTALAEELKRFPAKGLTASALKREKRRQFGDELAMMNDFAYLARTIGISLLAHGRADFADVYRRRLTAVTPDEVRHAADTLLSPEMLDQLIQRNAVVAPKHRSAGKTSGAVAILNRGNLRSVNFPKPASPMDYASLVIPGGAIFETPAERGFSKLWTQLLFCGGGGIGENEFLAKLDSLGAALDLRDGLNSFSIEINAPHKNFLKALEIIGKVIADPAVDGRQFQRETARLLEEIELESSTPQGAADRRARQLLFGAHPYAKALERDAVKKLTRENALLFWRKRFQRSRVVAGFSGSVDQERALELLLGGIRWQTKKLALPPEAVFPTRDCREKIALSREQLAVVRILPGVRLDDERQEKIFSLLRQNENGLFSRLFQDIREKEALVYSVGMRLCGGFQRGAFLFSGQTRPDQGERLADLLDAEIRRLGRSGVDPAEFSLAREREMFDNGSLTEHPELELEETVFRLYYGRMPETLRQKNDFLSRLTRAEFNRELRRVFADVPRIEVFAGALS